MTFYRAILRRARLCHSICCLSVRSSVCPSVRPSVLPVLRTICVELQTKKAPLPNHTKHDYNTFLFSCIIPIYPVILCVRPICSTRSVFSILCDLCLGHSVLVFTVQIHNCTKRCQVSTAAKLAAALVSGTADGVGNCWVQLPAQEDHSNHVLGEVRRFLLLLVIFLLMA